MREEDRMLKTGDAVRIRTRGIRHEGRYGKVIRHAKNGFVLVLLHGDETPMGFGINELMSVREPAREVTGEWAGS